MANDLTGNPLKIDTAGAGDLLTASAPLWISGFLWDPGTVPANVSTSPSGVNSAQTVTIVGAPGKRVTITEVALFASAAASVTLGISDGTTGISFGTLSLTPSATVLLVNETYNLGTSVSIIVGAGGVGITTTVSVAGYLTGGSCTVTDTAGHVLFQTTAEPANGAPISHVIGSGPGAGLLAKGLKVPTLSGVLLIYLTRVQ